ncbi:MAG: efflux RND transporter permease subunit [Planctomycetota bacterium]
MIWNFCIRRPVLTIVVFLIIAIFGLNGYFRMPLREFPDVDFPIVSVNVVLQGAEPEVIETEIIEPLEEQINTIEGLKQLTSEAREEVATIIAEFELWRDIDVAAQDVRDRVDRARRELPDDIEEPIVRKLDPDAQAIMWIALNGDDRWDEVRLTEYADKSIKERLQTVRGVGQIMLGGEREYAARIRLDPARLAAHHVTVQDVVGTIGRNNVDIPSGRIESQSREFLIKTRGQFAYPEPINDLIIAYRNGRPVRIGDVGEAFAGVRSDRQIARFKGDISVGLGVVKQSDANTVALAKAVRERMARIAETFPPGLTHEIAMDKSEYVQENVRDLVTTIFLATGLVVLVVLVFLRSGRGTLVTTLAIPTSLLAGMAIMFMLGFSLNTLSMLALVLAIGIVVDDGIVVLESSYRHMEEGAEARPATRTGTTEVAFPAIANTLSLAAVFIPVAFTGGLIGRFFFEFGLTVTVTVFASTLCALTLTPMLCSRVLRVPEKHGYLFRMSERHLNRLEAAYAWLLARAFRHRFVTIVLGLAAFGGGVYFLTQLKTEFVPVIDRSNFMIVFETPEGATLAETDRFAREIEAVLAETPEVQHQFLAIGLSRGGGPGKVNEGLAFVSLLPRAERETHQADLMQQMRQRFAELPGGRAFVLEVAAVGPGGAPLQMVLQHPDIDDLARQQDVVMGWMRQQDDYIGVNSDLRVNKPQVNVAINRDKASEMGISVADIANTMRYLLGEPDISKIERASERYDVITEIAGKGSMVPDMLRDLYVRGVGGALVSLGNLVEIEESIGPSAIHHFNRMRSVTISASTPPGVTLGSALQKLENYLDENLSGDFDYAAAGQAKDFEESFHYLTITIVFAVVFICLVLAAQFESFLHPFTILMSLPLAAIGAFGMLHALGMTFSIFTFIGLIMLLGLVTKNAILLLDYAKVLKARGRTTIDAAQQAARTRFRPVLMTAISTVLGMMPIALGFGAGAEARSSLGVVVAAGMSASTMLTLLVIPVVYSLLDQLQAWVLRIFHYDTRKARKEAVV